MARKAEITLRPRFGPPPQSRVVGWDVSDGKNIAANSAKEDAQRAWSKAITDHQAAGYEVTAIALGTDGKTVEAKGIYYPNGSMKDLGGAPAARSSRAAQPVVEALPAVQPRKPRRETAPLPPPAAAPRASRKAAGTGGKPAKAEKGQRAPSEYNLFAAKWLPKFRDQGYDNKDAMRMVAAEWKKKKGK